MHNLSQMQAFDLASSGLAALSLEHDPHSHALFTELEAGVRAVRAAYNNAVDAEQRFIRHPGAIITWRNAALHLKRALAPALTPTPHTPARSTPTASFTIPVQDARPAPAALMEARLQHLDAFALAFRSSQYGLFERGDELLTAVAALLQLWSDIGRLLDDMLVAKRNVLAELEAGLLFRLVAARSASRTTASPAGIGAKEWVRSAVLGVVAMPLERVWSGGAEARSHAAVLQQEVVDLEEARRRWVTGVEGSVQEDMEELAADLKRRKWGIRGLAGKIERAWEMIENGQFEADLIERVLETVLEAVWVVSEGQVEGQCERGGTAPS